MKIGELAQRSGVSIDAVRYYERRGVLPRAERTASGYRVFDDETVARLDLVRQLQDLGFTLDEVVDALQAHDRGAATCASERWRLELVGDRIDRKVKALQRTRRMIRATLAACDDGCCRLSTVAAQGASDQGTG
jgi:DNA-binding transcriptional MerR regulator